MTMKQRLIRIGIALGIILTVIIVFSVWDTTPTWKTADGAYAVTFVDYDGTVLKTIDCTAGEVCTITAPAKPDNKDNGYFTRWNLWESQWSEIDGNVTIKAVYTLDNRLAVIGGREIMFYSVFIMAGIMLALVFGLKEAKRTGLNKDDLIDGFLWIVPIAILGSRLWYVAFEWESFAYGGVWDTILHILGFSTGGDGAQFVGLSGLAIHGAFVFAAVSVTIYCRIRKISVWKVIDLVAVGFVFAQTFGRWGNFLNQEAHGGVIFDYVNGPLSSTQLEAQWSFLRNTLGIPEFIANNMYIIAGTHGSAVEPITAYYHPTFLYELMLNWVGFGVALVLRRLKGIRIGELMPFYLVWYGAVRIFIESMRTDPLVYDLFGLELQAATTTSVLMILGAVTLDLLIRFKWKTGSYGDIPGAFDFNEFRKKAKEPVQP
ncbi:MAG TPA: prolipoprotein diacylglyceryl transferase [Acholeplasmatales bacterium]|nr:prolipoprotein diacylglyceryl transferase [Acholeplasmatales bacterium]